MPEKMNRYLLLICHSTEKMTMVHQSVEIEAIITTRDQQSRGKLSYSIGTMMWVRSISNAKAGEERESGDQKRESWAGGLLDGSDFTGRCLYLLTSLIPIMPASWTKSFY